jgi:hypothetical protein
MLSLGSINIKLSDLIEFVVISNSVRMTYLK